MTQTVLLSFAKSPCRRTKVLSKSVKTSGSEGEGSTSDCASQEPDQRLPLRFARTRGRRDGTDLGDAGQDCAERVQLTVPRWLHKAPVPIDRSQNPLVLHGITFVHRSPLQKDDRPLDDFVRIAPLEELAGLHPRKVAVTRMVRIDTGAFKVDTEDCRSRASTRARPRTKLAVRLTRMVLLLRWFARLCSIGTGWTRLRTIGPASARASLSSPRNFVRPVDESSRIVGLERHLAEQPDQIASPVSVGRSRSCHPGPPLVIDRRGSPSASSRLLSQTPGP